jgi:hypothetical protein
MSQLIDLGKLRFHFAGEWLVSTAYEINDIVKYGGNSYVYTYPLKEAGNIPTDPLYWALILSGVDFVGTYNGATAYRIRQTVLYGGSMYIAIQDTTGNLPTDSIYWTKFTDGLSMQSAYNIGTAYKVGEVVTYGGGIYRAIVNTVAGNLPTDDTKFQPLIVGVSYMGVWSAAIAYTVGESVTYGGNFYRAIVNTAAGNLPTDVSKFTLLNPGIRSNGVWTTATSYIQNDVVTYGGNTYIALTTHTSGAFATDLSANRWQKFVGGVRYRGAWLTSTAYLIDDVVTNGSSTYIAIQDHTSGIFATDVSDGKWNMFALGQANVPDPIGAADNQALVTLSNAYVLRKTPPDPTNGTNGHAIIVSSGAYVLGPAYSELWTVRNSAYTASTIDYILADTSASAFTVTLPISPSVGNVVKFYDQRGTWSTRNVTVARNGSLINGLAENLVANISNGHFSLAFVGGSIGWQVIIL